MASKSRNDNYNGVRVTVHSTGSFDAVITRLYSEIGSPEQGLARLNEIKTVRDRETFIDRVKKATGTTSDQNVMDRFMIFQEFNHGAWLPLFDVGGGRKCKRILLGNPLVALTMLRHEMKAGLSVPVELLVVEGTKEESGGVDLVYHLPSALIAVGGDNPELEAAARKLDEKLHKLVLHVAS